MNELERKALLKATFDTVAPGYDKRALRFFPESAKHLAGCFEFKGTEHVLDVASGTGVVALEVAGLLPGGQVTAVDFSGNMLAQARAKAEMLGIQNLNLMEMDMQALDFPDNHFDAALCAFGIFFVEDMEHQLKHISDKVKPGGRIIISSFYDDSFLPLSDIFFNLIEKYGIERPPLTWKKISTEEKCSALYQRAGLSDIQVIRKDLGYHLENAGEWWDVIWNAGFRGVVSRLSPGDLERFKEEHLKEIEKLSTENGIWLNIRVLYTIGSKKSGDNSEKQHKAYSCKKNIMPGRGKCGKKA